MRVIPDQEVLDEAARVLLEHLSPSKVARLWAAWQLGSGDYLLIRHQLFGDETVASLIEKVQAHENAASDKAE